MFFAWRFIIDENYVVLIDHIILETIRLFCFCILFSNMYPKIKLTAKIGLTNAVSTVKCFFVSEKIIFYVSLLKMNYNIM